MLKCKISRAGAYAVLRRRDTAIQKRRNANPWKCGLQLHSVRRHS
nr:MAG TPA: hypothetical protein [Caudoviricetes sp.]DAU09902.1 MAG TPA: hypothetical protein [Caudoviricetes sp.]